MKGEAGIHLLNRYQVRAVEPKVQVTQDPGVCVTFHDAYGYPQSDVKLQAAEKIAELRQLADGGEIVITEATGSPEALSRLGLSGTMEAEQSSPTVGGRPTPDFLYKIVEHVSPETLREAEQAFRRQLAANETVLGESAALIPTLRSLSKVCIFQDNYSEALRLRRRALAMAEETWVQTGEDLACCALDHCLLDLIDCLASAPPLPFWRRTEREAVHAEIDHLLTKKRGLAPIRAAAPVVYLRL